jgi:endonuclease III
MIEEPSNEESRNHKTDYLIQQVIELARALEQEYHTPDLGNRIDPLEELVYIVLTNRAIHQNYSRTWEILIKNFPSWDKLANAQESEITQVIRSGGLGKQKARTIKLSLQHTLEAFGEYTLFPLQSWSDAEILKFLCEIPGVGTKSAKCVMMYSLNRLVFPVDTHIRRILERVGILSEESNPDSETIENLVPPELRYSLHVNLVYHGQQVCRARWMKCRKCFLNEECISSQLS